MPVSPDLFALTLLMLMALIAIFLRLRFGQEEDEDETAPELFYRQRRIDPVQMRLPLTGLGGDHIIGDEGYLPAELNHLLNPRAQWVGEDADAAGLEAITQPGPAAPPHGWVSRLTWTISSLVILLGLILIIFRIIASSLPMLSLN